MKRKHWIDSIRGISMIAILLYHTEFYYTGKVLINYSLYVTNVLILFFFVSGYLMYKTDFDIGKKIKSIFKGLLIPYFCFTTIIAIPKSLAHGTEIEIGSILFQIFWGKASWFVASLCVSETFFAFAIHKTKGKIKVLALISFIGFICSLYFNNLPPYPWQIGNSLLTLPFLFAGYTYHKYETKYRLSNKTPIIWLALLCIFFVSIKIIEVSNNINLIIWPININNYPIFLIDEIICIIIMTLFCKRLPICHWLEWVGKHSLAGYFLCGGTPLVTSIFFNKIGLVYGGNYFNVLLVLLSVFITTTLCTWIIYKYIPFIVGK